MKWVGPCDRACPLLLRICMTLGIIFDKSLSFCQSKLESTLKGSPRVKKRGKKTGHSLNGGRGQPQFINLA